MNNGWWKHENISKEQNTLLLRYALILHPLKVPCFKDINWGWMLYMNRQVVPNWHSWILKRTFVQYNCRHVDLSILEWISDVKVKGVLKYSGAPPWRVLYICRAFRYIISGTKCVYNLYMNRLSQSTLVSTLCEMSTCSSSRVKCCFLVNDRKYIKTSC